MHNCNQNTELSSHEGTHSEFNQGTALIKLGIDVHQRFYVVVAQHEAGTPKPPQRFVPPAFLHWVRKLREQGHEVHAVYEACGFGYWLYRELLKLGAGCVVVSPQKLDERGKRVKTDGIDARALCSRLDRWLQGNQEALAVVRVPTPEQEQLRSIHRLREQLVKARKQLEAQGRSLLVNSGFEAQSHWWKARSFARLQKELPAWIVARLTASQPIVELLDKQVREVTTQLQAAAAEDTPRGLGALTSVVIAREVCDWKRFNNRRAIGSYTGLCPGEYSSGTTRVQGCVTKHGNPRLRAALVELAWRMVRFQPNYPPVAKWRLTLAKGSKATGAARKKAIVAVARQLAVDLWRLNTGRLTAEELGLTI
jgi:transposase